MLAVDASIEPAVWGVGMARRIVKPDRIVLLIIAAALGVALVNIALSTTPAGAGKAGAVPLALFVYWRISRGGHIARGFELFVSIFGGVLFASEIPTRHGITWGWLRAVAFGVEAALLLSPPVRRYFGELKSRREGTLPRVSSRR